MAQISNGISNPVVAGIVYWLIRILVCGGCLVGAGILVAFIGILSILLQTETVTAPYLSEIFEVTCWSAESG